ncbi:uncharacterized protein PV09_01419 [Verruconis gallopava]|uniref:Fungal N-terminal domain-containing protein n=1 Tax=Verruconis gallopava TaxID=253628 RepID=A0A0D2APW8_9PEZI|nr:uncharacterized protein PV09_01419 [Verruconis gallopava]KIW08530.1 hypothetical protein PV09_01419 [Verruconis gallopava]
MSIGGYKNFSNDIRALQNSLQDIEDALVSNTIPTSENELSQLISSCENALNELSSRVDKFNCLPLQSQRTWDRLSWGQDGESKLRDQLSSLPQELGAFYKRLRESPSAQIDRALQLLVKEVSNGRHETSTTTSLSTAAANRDDQARWEQLIHDLGDLGIEEKMVVEHKDFIVDWILKAINDGVLTGEKMPTEAESILRSLSPPLESLESLSPTLESLPNQSLDRQSTPSPSIVSSKTTIHASTTPPVYVQLKTALPSKVDIPPRPNMSASPPRPVSIISSNQFSSTTMHGPPPPPNTDSTGSNIQKNAEMICFHWNGREWKHAQESLKAQIACVERGETIHISGVPQQPNVRILRYLLGISYSLSGDYITARDIFESILLEANIQQLAFDDGDIAAARWLGETCIMLNQLVNASLAWAISYYGTLFKNPPQPPGNHRDKYMLEDLRLLNSKTGGLHSLKSAFTKTNRDASSILVGVSASLKFQLVSTVLEVISQYDKPGHTTRRLPPIISIAEGFLTQPLVANQSWPLPQDPFFRVDSSIDLLYALSRPHAPINTTAISTISLGKSKSLIYVTRNSINWLVEAIRFALNSLAIEWKIYSSEYLLRFSQTHEHIAYYDCFAIRFHKLSFRNLYGFKLNGTTYSTRQFTHTTTANQLDENARKEILRAELAAKLQKYVKQAEIDYAKGKWPPKEAAPPRSPRLSPRRTAIEMDSENVPRSELADQNEPVHELMSYEIAELPG